LNQKRSSDISQELKSKIILFIFDIYAIFISLFVGFILGNSLYFIGGSSSHLYISESFGVIVLYIIIPVVFFYEGIYTYRFDFWHEARIINKGLILSFLIVFAFLALADGRWEYSRVVVICSFISMMFIIPIMKIIVKKKLFKLGLWKTGVKILSQDNSLGAEIFNNPYLGYIKSKREKETNIVFLDAHNSDIENTKKQLEHEISSKNKVMFVPVLDNHQLSSSDIFELTNCRISLIVLQNRLNSKLRMFINVSYNYILAILITPFLLPIIGIIALLVKYDSKGPVFFRQERLSVGGKTFSVFKFRTMYINGDEILDKYLDENPEEKENYEKYSKYKNDPRITKIGRILRRTSLDELVQIFNILSGDMTFVGPRPYMLSEKEKIGVENIDLILKVKPGITGLWQVSGRNELSFKERVDIDKWYIYNWSLWIDLVIFLKTINIVLNKSGAK